MCLLIAAFMCISEDNLWGISSLLPPHGHWGLNCGCQLGRKDPSPPEQSCLLPFAFVFWVSVYDLRPWGFVYANVDTWMSAMTFM